MAPKAATIDRLGPEIPADLTALDDAALRALADEARAADSADAEVTATYADMLEELIANVERIDTELAARDSAAAERAERVTAARARLHPVGEAPGAPSADPSSEGAGPAQAPEGADAPEAHSGTPAGTSTPAPPVTARVPAVPASVAASAGYSLDAATLQTLLARSTAGTVVSRRERPEPTALPCSIVASADIPGFGIGQRLSGITDVARAISERHRVLGHGRGGDHADKVIVASLQADYPEARRISGGDVQRNQRVLNDLLRRDPKSGLTAAGGLANALEPYYDFMTIADAGRPFRDSLVTVQGIDAHRGGLRIVPPLTFADAGPTARTIADAVTNSTILVTSATANFTASDIGATIVAADIPAGTYISAILSTTNANMSQAATASTAAHAATITRPGAAGRVTVAQDAAALGAAGGSSAAFAGTKPPFRIPVPGPIDVPVSAIYAALRFGNFQALAWPELIEGWLKLMMAQWARVGDTALLDQVIADSLQMTAATIYGGARQLIAQALRHAAFFRNVHRAPRRFRLNIALPAWVADAAVAEMVLGSAYDADFFNIDIDEIEDRFSDLGYDVAWYIDTPTSVGQLMNNGIMPAGGGVVPTFPTTVEAIIYAPDSYTFIDDGVLNLGLVRDPQVTGNAPGVVTTMGLRDSALAATNDVILMTESFEGVVRTGIRGHAITFTVAWNGAAAPVAAALATI